LFANSCTLRWRERSCSCKRAQHSASTASESPSTESLFVKLLPARACSSTAAGASPRVVELLMEAELANVVVRPLLPHGPPMPPQVASPQLMGLQVLPPL